MMIVAIAIGGAIGAVLRYGASNWVAQIAGTGFPYGTLFVNVVGSLLAGACYVMLAEKVSADSAIRGLIMVGLLGSFTTFATFSLETLQLIEAGALFKAVLNSVLSVVICVAAAWLAVVATRAWFITV